MNKELNDSLKELSDYANKLKEMFGETEEEEFDYESMLNEHGLSMTELENQLVNQYDKIKLPYKKVHPEAVVPKYNYENDSGFDLYSTIDIEVAGLGRALIPTGLSFDVKDGYEIQVRSKSGLAINQGLMCLNSPGTVDCGYLGEIKVIIFNTNKEPFMIKKGMKVAQAVFCPVLSGKWVEPVETQEFSKTERGDKGFGSTGI